MRLKGVGGTAWYHYGVRCVAVARDSKTVVAGTTMGYRGRLSPQAALAESGFPGLRANTTVP